MVTTKTRLAKIESWMNAPSTLARITAIAPKHQRAERIIKLAWFQIQSNPKLAECTPKSIAECVLTCAQLGLEPNSVSQHAHFIPFNDRKAGTVVCTLVPGYKGLIDLAMRTGRFVTFRAQVVRTGDEFDHQDEPPLLYHKRAEVEDLESDILYAYAVAVHNDANHYRSFHVCSTAYIDTVRARSRGKNAQGWVSHYPAMAMKTALIRHLKYIGSSVELASIVTLDEQADSGIKQTLVKVDDATLDGFDDDTCGPGASPQGGASLSAGGEPASGAPSE
jgi:recombination protein RecT